MFRLLHRLPDTVARHIHGVEQSNAAGIKQLEGEPDLLRAAFDFAHGIGYGEKLLIRA